MNRIQTSAVVLWLGLAVSAMAAEPVQERFQKALFEEEANQNIPNAITGYESVLDAADAPIRFAATALYRLGECYRKLGRTNDAIAAYERLVREFPGQSNVVRLGRQNLSVLGRLEAVAAGKTLETAPSVANTKAHADLAEAAQIEGVVRLIEEYREVAGKDWESALLGAFPSPAVNRIEDAIREGQTRLRRLSVNHAPGTTEFNAAERELQENMKQRVQELNRLLESKKMEVEVLRSGAVAQMKALGIAAAVPAAPVDPEDAEIERLKKLEKDTPDLLRTGSANDVAPIEQAVGRGQTRVVEYLLGRGIALEASRRLNRLSQSSLLEMAVINGQVAMVDLLLARGVDVNQRGSVDSTPLHWAVVRGYESVVEHLLQAKPDLELLSGPLMGNPPSTPLGLAVFGGNLPMTRRLMAAGAKLQQPAGREPLLFRALKSKSPGMLQRLLEAGANPGEVFADRTVVHEAVLAELPEQTVPLLVAKGADVNARTFAGEPPLLWSLQRNLPPSTSRPALVALLLKSGANPNLGTEQATPLIAAVETGNAELVRLLLGAGADPNLRIRDGDGGFTPLELLQARAGQPQAGGVSGTGEPGRERASWEELAEVLRKAGARDYLPDPDSIRIRKSPTERSFVVIRRDASNLNRLTALEAIATFYGWLDPVGHLQDVRRKDGRPGALAPRFLGLGLGKGFDWPAWNQVSILRPREGGTGWDRVPLNVSNLLTGANCGDSPAVHWGDVIEIPGPVPTLGGSDPYKGLKLWPAVTNCLFSARFTLVVAGRTNVLGAGFEKLGNGMNLVSRPAGLCDWLVTPSLPANADVSRVRVRRQAFRDQPAWDRTFDLSKDQPEQADLFLRDGDVIEVPEKP
jgi:ankyrin repeat protein